MSVLVVNDFLSGRAVDDLSTFLDESKLWESFSCNKDTRRDAFNFTLKLDELPDFLTEFKTPRHNLYHFVAIRTYKSGSIDEHVDFALGEQLIHNQGMLISKPETLVYYETIDPGMIGGELVIDGGVFKPVQNTAVIMSPNTSHAVTAIKEAVKPRVVLVCERYRVLSKYLKDIKTPDYQKG
jgi:hypothetical protein